ncbi:MAG: T9SS type A sorting domain-containing protein [Bacteroidia bacterium]
MKKTKLLLAFCLSCCLGFAQLTLTVKDDCNGLICQGGKDVVTAVPLGGSGSYHYSWNTTPVQTTQQIVFNPGSNPSTNTIASGQFITCTITDNFTHFTATYNFYYSVISTGANPFPAINVSATTVCPYDTVKIAPGNANSLLYNSTYCDGSTFNSQVCNIVPAPPIPASYSITLSDAGNTCRTDASFVLHLPTPCFAFGYSNLATNITSQSQIPAGNFYIHNNTTIAANINLTGKTILIAAGVKVTVLSGFTLTMSRCYMHSCSCMWYGIEVDGTATIAATNCIFEDAINAICTDNVLTSLPTINVNNSLFNKNNIGIAITQKSGAVTTNILNNIFTCRSNFTYSNLALFGLFYPFILNDFTTNWQTINTSYPQALTKYNHLSNVGVLVVNCTGTGISIGNNSNYNNIFDNLNIGVFSALSNVSVGYGQFQNLTGNASYNPMASNQHITATGVGIYADNLSNSYGPLANNITVGSCTFNNTLRGVDIYNYLSVNVSGNTFYNTKTDALSSFATNGSWVGQYGLQVSYLGTAATPAHTGTTGLPICYVVANKFSYTATGIHIMRSYYDAGSINISCNDVGAANQLPSATKYINKGISVEDVIGNPSSNIGVNSIAITGNNVFNARQNCIYASNVKKGLYIFYNGKGNHFSTPPNLSIAGTVPGVDVGGIQTDNCSNGTIRCNSKISSGVNSYLPSVYNLHLNGILINNSPNMYVADNQIGGFYSGICFRGGSTNATFNNCALNYGHFGMVLDNCAIGTQGSPGSPVHVAWTTASAGNQFATYNLNSPDPNQNSILNIAAFDIPPAAQNAGTPGACGSLGNIYNANPSSGCIGLISSNNYSGSSYNVICPVALPSIDGGDICGPQTSLLPTAATKLTGPQMSQILQDTALAGNPQAASRIWHNQRFLWSSMFFDTLYPTANTATQAFYNANQNSGLGMLAKIDDALNKKNTTAAAAFNSFSPANNFEVKQQQVNAVKIKMADTTATMPVNAADISSLQSVANGCPETDGMAFYEARSILNLLYGQELVYTSNCASGNQYRLAEVESVNQVTDNEMARIYPNPAATILNIDYATSNNAAFVLYDINGRVVLKQVLNAGQNHIEISGFDLQNGLYMYHIYTNDGQTLQKGKVTILK